MLVLIFSFVVQILSIILVLLFVHPLISPLRHLPSAPQRPLLQRILKEPSPYHFEQWINSVPNDGLIRYFGFLNVERVLVASPEAAHQILVSNAYNFEKPYAAKIHLHRVAGKGLVWQEGNAHKYHRAVMNVAFKRKQIQALHSLFWSKATELADAICEQVKFENRRRLHTDTGTESGIEIEVEDYAERAVFDITGLAGNGSEFQGIAEPEGKYAMFSDIQNAFKPSPSQRIRMMASFALPQWMVDSLPLENNRIMARVMKDMRILAKEVIAKKRSEKGRLLGIPDVLQIVLEQGKFSEEELLDTFLTIQAGGTHTTAAALTSCIWWLAQPKYHHIQLKLRKEIREMQPGGSSERMFESMPYLEAVMKETLRLHSAFTWLGRQPIHETNICGSDLPIGVSISISPWAMHRSTAIWGPDAQVFRPERWLTDDAVVRNRHCWLAFGGGPRTCIGEKFAQAELRCLISSIFRDLEFRFPDEAVLPQVCHLVTLAFRSKVRPLVKLVD